MSKNNCLIIQDIYDSAEKFGRENVLVCFLDVDNWTKEKFGEDPFRDNKKNGKKNDCTWVAIRFRHIDGSFRRAVFKFKKVLTASKAKIPAKVEKESAKYLNIAFKVMEPDEIRGGDFVARIMPTDAEQAKENARIESNINTYYENTKTYFGALDILNASFMRIANELKEKSKKDVGFTVKKNKSSPTVAVFPIIQTTMKDEESEEEFEIEPIARIKLPSGSNTRKIGIDMYNYESKSRTFKPIVYDARKMNSKNDHEPVFAKVRVGSRLVHLDIDNAGSFITYKSIIGGTFEITEIIVSTFGISMATRFRELFVRRHKTKLIEPPFTKKDIIDLNDGEISDEDDEDAVLDDDADVGDDDEDDQDVDDDGQKTNMNESDEDSD